MSLFVRVFNNFYTHRKTARLEAAIGDAAFWVPPRLWAYAAENQPDGCFQDYAAEEIALLIGYSGDAQAMLQAMLRACFMDSDPLRIHDWADYNDYHAKFSERAKKAANTRWDAERRRQDKRRDREERRGEEASIAKTGDKQCLEHKSDIYHKDSRSVLFLLNEGSGSGFREVDSNLSVISARLSEPDVTLDGIRQMITRQCGKWKGTEMGEYLRPATLFSKSKFDSYYAAKDQPIPEKNGKPPTKTERQPDDLHAPRL